VPAVQRCSTSSLPSCHLVSLGKAMVIHNQTLALIYLDSYPNNLPLSRTQQCTPEEPIQGLLRYTSTQIFLLISSIKTPTICTYIQQEQTSYSTPIHHQTTILLQHHADQVALTAPDPPSHPQTRHSPPPSNSPSFRPTNEIKDPRITGLTPSHSSPRPGTWYPATPPYPSHPRHGDIH
jgi:hypothetical protein